MFVHPKGVTLTTLSPHADSRGQFTEIFRDEWAVMPHPLQWNVVRSEAGVLRGFHVHLIHEDYLTVIEGQALIVLKDLRSESETSGLVSYVPLMASEPQGIYIPTRVAHGFYFLVPSIHVYAVTAYWNSADELGCRFDDPALGIDWPNANPILSERDQNLPNFSKLMNELKLA